MDRMSFAPFVTAMPAIVSTTSPVGLPDGQIGPFHAASPPSNVTLYVQIRRARFRPCRPQLYDRVHREHVDRIPDVEPAAVIVREVVAPLRRLHVARLASRDVVADGESQRTPSPSTRATAPAPTMTFRKRRRVYEAGLSASSSEDLTGSKALRSPQHAIRERK